MHRLDGRDVQRIIRRVARHNGRGQRQTQRVEDARRDLELGPVGIVLAVTELYQSLLGQDLGVGVGGGGVDADGVRRQLIDADGLLVQLPLQGSEGDTVGQSLEQVRQAVVVGVAGPDRLTEQGREDALVLGDPGLDMVEAVIALGDQEEEPEGQDLAGAERAFPVGRGRKVTVQAGRQVQPLQLGPQDRQVGHGLHTQQARFDSVHPSSLLALPIPENHPKHERTVG